MNRDYKTIYDLLTTLNIEVAYDHFDDNKTIQPPFIVYRALAADTFEASNKTYYKANNFEIELVTTIKNPTLEGQIENLLDENEIPYDQTDPIWDDDEKIYHTFYEI